MARQSFLACVHVEDLGSSLWKMRVASRTMANSFFSGDIISSCFVVSVGCLDSSKAFKIRATMQEIEIATKDLIDKLTVEDKKT
jgi:ribonucleotide reductase alpha subunit